MSLKIQNNIVKINMFFKLGKITVNAFVVWPVFTLPIRDLKLNTLSTFI